MPEQLPANLPLSVFSEVWMKAHHLSQPSNPKRLLASETCIH
jgi:hypothetical protein